MSNFDSVEKLRSRANVSYEDDKNALDACNDDLLEALIYLEKQGKVTPPQGGSYSSKSEPVNSCELQAIAQKTNKGKGFSETMNNFFKWCSKVFHNGNTNYFEVWRNNEKILTVPITVLVLLLIFAFWATLPLLIIGLFLSCRYIFRGRQIESIDMNSVMDSAADAADNLKNEVKNATCNHDNTNKKD